MFYVVAGLILLFAFFILYLLIKIILNIISNIISGKKVVCTVKEVKRNEIKEKDGAISAMHINALCEFEYDGKKHEKEIFVENLYNVSSVKVGDKINCTYNSSKKQLVPINTDKKSIWFAMFIVLGILTVIYLLFIYKKGIITNANIEQGMLYGLFLMAWYFGLFNFYNPFSKKANWIKLRGEVVKYHLVFSDIDSNHISWDYYSPEVKFKYNGEEKSYIVKSCDVKRKYSIGQEIDIYYDPDKKDVHITRNNRMFIIMMLIPIVIIIFELLSYFIK